MATTRGALSVTIPSGSVLDLTPASCNIGSFTSFIFSGSAVMPGLPSYAHRAVFRAQVGTAAWTTDTSLGSYPNASWGVITSAGDPKPVLLPGPPTSLKVAALGGTSIVNFIFYEGGELDI